MLPKSHIILGIIFSLLLYFFMHVSIISALVVLLSSVLIDIDHYLWYVFRKKDLSLANSYRWYKNLPFNHKPMFHFMHSVEFLILTFLLSFIFPVFLFIFLGFIFHSIADILEFAYDGNIDNREYFFIRYFFSDRENYL